jgi:hypothetical protein
MALHRDIYWVGRQWAVTGYGIQACDQKQKGQFDIEGSRLWEDGVQELVRAQKWFNSEDFDKAVSVARKYYPESSRESPPEEPVLQPAQDVSPQEPLRPQTRKLEARQDMGAKFLAVWRIRMHLSGR